MRDLRKVFFLTLVMILSINMLIACGDNTVTPTVATQGAVTASPAATTKVAAFPRTITDGSGRKVTIARKPERIAVLSFDVAEVVLPAVEPGRVIATARATRDTTLSNVVELAQKVPNVFADNNPDSEKLVSLKPDLVLITLRHTGEQDFAKIMEEASIPIVEINNWDGVAQIKSNITLLTAAVGEEEKGQTMNSEIDRRLEAVKNRVSGVKDKLRVLPIWAVSGGVTSGPGTLLHEIIVAAGGKNAAEEMGAKGTMPVDVEKVVKINPDAILLTDFQWQTPQFNSDLINHPALAGIKAKQTNRIYTLPSKYIFAGPQFVQGVETLAKLLYPDLF